MAFHVRDDETDSLVRQLAAAKGVGLTQAVRLAVASELKRVGEERLQRQIGIDAILAEMDRLPRTGLKADKAFFDELSGD